MSVRTETHLVSRTLRLPEAPDLLAALPSTGGFLWIRREEGLVAWGEAARIDPGTGDARFDRASAALEALFGGAAVEDEVGRPGSGPVAFGAFTFDPASAGSSIVVPSVVIGRAGDRAWMTFVGRGALPEAPPLAAPGEPPRGNRIRTVGSSVPEQRWTGAVEQACDAIRTGSLEKVVLARRVDVEAERPFDVPVIARHLASVYPECFTFAFEGLVGATPELLVTRRGDLVESLPLAGTAPRGASEAEDEELGRRLLAPGKDRREHDLAVRTVVESLQPLITDLSVDPEPSLFRLATVQHLATKVRGRLNDAQTALDLAGALHPTAAVCGVPRDEAMAAIRRLEGFERGRYAGPVGWVDARGDGEWAVALRCAELEGRSAHLYAGAGIVAESQPDGELEEIRLKLQPMLTALES